MGEDELGGLYRAVAELRAQLAAREEELDRLRCNEEQFRSIFEEAPVMIDAFDESGRCVLWNRECERILGWTTEEMLSTPEPFRIWYPDPEEHDRARDLWQRASGRFHDFEVRDKAGCLHYQRWANFSLASGQRISIGYDRTHERAIEANLRRRHKLEAIGELASGVAHDFNNLLTIVLSSLGTLRNRVGTDQRALRSIERSEQAAERGARMVKQLLAFSHEAVLAPERVQLSHVVAEALELLEQLMPATLSLVFDATSEDTTALVDPTAVEQIVMNLTANARDATNSRGTVRFQTERRRGADGRDRIVLRVSDDGAGMDPATLGRVFEPYFTTKQRGMGAGLGLPLVYGLVQQHGGTVEIESQPGQGTAVELTLPAHDGAGAAPEPEPRGRGRTILLVEDERGIRQAVGDLLDDWGYSVRTAANGLEALAALSESGSVVDLVISDVVMPQMDGPALLNAAREQGVTAQFVFTTGYGADRLEGIDDAGVAVLLKPWAPDELEALLEDLLGSAPSTS